MPFEGRLLCMEIFLCPFGFLRRHRSLDHFEMDLSVWRIMDTNSVVGNGVCWYWISEG